MVVAGGGEGDGIKVGAHGRVRDVEGVVVIDVAVDGGREGVEDLVLQGDGGLHYEGVEVEPPEPNRKVSWCFWEAEGG